ALEVAEKFKTKQAEIEASKAYTEAGRRQTMMSLLVKEFAPQFRRAQAPIVRAMADAKARRNTFVLPAPDQSNIAAALERQEIRAYVARLPAAKRLPFALESRDRRIIEAVLSAPRALSGFSEADFDLLHKDAME